MLLFAHIGITLGVALACDRIFAHRQKRSSQPAEAARVPGSENTEPSKAKTNRVRKLFDFRFWILGSILPDLIDKPVGHFLFNQAFHNNGRIFSHTLLFFLVIFGAGLYLGISRRRMWLLALSLGVLVHLVLDSMWLTPQTLLWPLFGWNFPYLSDFNWALTMLWEYFHDPSAYIPELVGLPFIIWFVYKLIRNRRVVSFLRDGYY
jgi:inner membrane protein